MQVHSDALAYLITYHTYGTWLHGDKRGSVDRNHNIPDTAVLPYDSQRNESSTERLKHTPVILDENRRTLVDRTIREVATHRGWILHASNVRTNHVHLVVSAISPPEKVMNDFKSWSTRRLVEAGLFPKGRKIWTRHGSTKYLWNEKSLQDACQYVVEGQGIDLTNT